MKKNLLFILLAMIWTPMLLCAQIKDKGFFIEMNGGYGTIKHNSGHDGYVFLSPAMGYQINERWAAGLRTRFELAGDKYTTIGLYGQYNFCRLNRFNLFGEAVLSYSSYSAEGGDPNYVEAGLSFGVSYSLGKHWKLLLRYPYIGYCGDNFYNRNDDFCLGGGDFILDGNLRRLQLGMQLIF